MPAPIPMPVRQVIFKRWRKGDSLAVIAQELKLSLRTVQHLIHRLGACGDKGLEPDYARCATRKLPKDSELFQKALALREQHPGWGGGLIRVILKEQGNDAVPSERTLQRWFQRSQLAPAPPGERPAGDDRRAHEPHDVWQMDAVDQLPLASGQQVSWLRLVDECSGAVLRTTIFPPALLESGQAGSRPRDVALGFFAVGKACALPRR
jgi:transposase